MHFPTEIVVTVIFILLANIFPYQPGQTFVVSNLKVLQKQYAKWEFFAVIPFFILMASMVYGFGNLFFWMNSTPEKSKALHFLITPNLYMWFAPATCLAFAIIAFPMSFIFRLLLRERYDEYLHYTNLKHGFDGVKIYRPIALMFGLFAIVSIFLMSDYTVEISKKQIILNDFLTTGEKEYDFKGIKSIFFVENTISKDQKAISPYPHYYVKFIDGNYWNTLSGLNTEFQQDEIMKYLSEKSNLKIDTVSYLID